MRTLKTIHTLFCHAGGEVGDVIIDGVELPHGRTVAEMRDFIEAERPVAGRSSPDRYMRHSVRRRLAIAGGSTVKRILACCRIILYNPRQVIVG